MPRYHFLEENTHDGSLHVFTTQADNADEASYKVQDYQEQRMSGQMEPFKSINHITCMGADNCMITPNSIITVHNIEE
jgi:hypothetical protein